MSNLNSSGGGLQYRGTKAIQPPNCSFHTRDPNEFDRFGYSLLDLWLNTTTDRIFCLVSLEGNASSAGIRAIWSPLESGSSTGGILNTTGNDAVEVFPDVVGNLNIMGTDPLFVTGNPGTNTETITIATATTAQIGATTLATSAQTRTGTNSTNVVTPVGLASKLGTQTTNAVPFSQGSTSAFGWTSAGTDGQVIIASTGSSPNFATITSGDGSITFIPGSNSLDIRASISGGSNIKTTVFDTPGTYDFTKDPLAKVVEVWGWGGGGGGIGATSGVFGGVGGGSGSSMHYKIPESAIDNGLLVNFIVVGAGGLGLSATSSLTNGTYTGFGNWQTESVNNGPGQGGAFGSALGGKLVSLTNLTANQGGSSESNGGVGLGGFSNVFGAMMPTGGGGGGGSFTVPSAGGQGGRVTARGTSATILAGGVGGAVGIDGGSGVDGYPTPSGLNFLCGGTGGGGGGTGADGGNGGFPGGGGGGGGSFAGSATFGGNGGDGLLIVIEYLSD